MTTERATNIGWLSRAAASAFALTLLFGGWTAIPAGARPSDPDVINANNFIDWCFANDGEPDSNDSGGFVTASCTFSDGSNLHCTFWADGTTSCNTLGPNDGLKDADPPPKGCNCGKPPAPPLTRPPSGPGQPGGPVQNGGSPLPDPDGSGAVQTGGSGQLNIGAPDQPKTPKHYKGKNGKK